MLLLLIISHILMLIAGMRNFLEDFYEFVRIPAPPSLVVPRLFPRTLRMPGWRHIFDNAIKRGLTSQLWFPRFLQALKGVVAFFS